MSTFGGVPESPDNKSIRAQLDELKNLNSSTVSYNKRIVGIGIATVLIGIFGLLAALLK